MFRSNSFVCRNPVLGIEQLSGILIFISFYCPSNCSSLLAIQQGIKAIQAKLFV
jgi:hypothetical protein